MRRLDWFLVAVIAVFLGAAVAAQTVSGAMARLQADGGEALVERLVIPAANAMAADPAPMVAMRRR
ncbi:MAG TPA: hypothetical protein VGG29_06510 [Caulobacteraceae bacterium]|jgi:hypothetical protein